MLPRASDGNGERTTSFRVGGSLDRWGSSKTKYGEAGASSPAGRIGAAACVDVMAPRVRSAESLGFESGFSLDGGLGRGTDATQGPSGVLSHALIGVHQEPGQRGDGRRR